MSKRILVVVAAAAAILAISLVGVANSRGFWGDGYRHHDRNITINWSVSGTIVYHPIPVADPATDPPVFFLINAFLKGVPEKAQFTVLGIPYGPPQDSHPKCDGNSGQSFYPNDMVITFEDLSMLFAELEGLDGGWVCVQPDGTVTAEAHMSIIGGTGKYQDASGWFIGKFNGQQVGMSGLLQAETGTIVGEIER